MTPQLRYRAADIISNFRGVYARIARKLDVSASMVSRVADGSRTSPDEELTALKVKLDKYL